MITELNEAAGLYRVTTEHGTQYIIDLTKGRGKRIPAPNRNPLRADNKWFKILWVRSCRVGEPMYMQCHGIASEDYYTWRETTTVTKIEDLRANLWTRIKYWLS